jgi:dipeptidase D
LSAALPGCAILSDAAKEEAADITIGGVSFKSDVSELDLSGLGIRDISALGDCRNLRYLKLGGNEIIDLTALMNLPAGIQRMSFSMPGMVQTSLNLGILRTEEKEVVLSYCVRSSVESEKRYLTQQLHCLVEQLGGSVEEIGDYPGWEYRQESPLRDKMVEVFERLYGRKPVVQSMHAGVECGIFTSRLPGMDCVSFGPDMKDIHTPQESMSVESVKRTWDYLLTVLKELR